jgi:hypothetical protein
VVVEVELVLWAVQEVLDQLQKLQQTLVVQDDLP